MKKVNTSVLTVLLLHLGLTTAHANLPDCLYQSSDFDGDGYGYENNASCLIAENSIGQVPSANDECIDSDGDGWGWNGITSCEAVIQPATCVDTAPLGDGWGWDGVSSCVVTDNDNEPHEPVFNELDELKKHFIDVNVPTSINTRAAVAICPGSRLYFFEYTGSMIGNTRTGLWSTGISASDTRLLLAFGSPAGSGVFTVPFRISENGIWEGENQTLENQCQWMQP